LRPQTQKHKSIWNWDRTSFKLVHSQRSSCRSIRPVLLHVEFTL